MNDTTDAVQHISNVRAALKDFILRMYTFDYDFFQCLDYILVLLLIQQSREKLE